MPNDLKTYLSSRSISLPERISIQEAANLIVKLHRQNGGATFNLYFGDQSGQRLYAVSLYPERSKIIDGQDIKPEILEAFLKANLDLLADPRCCIGTWFNSEDGLTYLDVSVLMPNKREALSLAKRYNQIGIFGLSRSEVIETGGTGEPPVRMPPVNERLPERGRREKKP